MGSHLIDGKFKSDKFPETPAGLVPLACTDESAQDLLWEYAQRRRAKDAEFSADLEQALRNAGYASPGTAAESRVVTCAGCGNWERVGEGAHEHSSIKSSAQLRADGWVQGLETASATVHAWFCRACARTTKR